MRDMLRESQPECESLRRIPDHVDAAFDEAGFYRVLQPQRFGGEAAAWVGCDAVSIERVRQRAIAGALKRALS
jgi:hypothetical protein